jgi:TrmH family RNA methyltransferase
MTPPRKATISSAANPRIQSALELRDRRGRDRAGRLLVDGAREVGRALDAGVAVVEAFIGAGDAHDEEAAAVLDRLRAAAVPLVHVSGAAQARLAFGQRGSDVVAVVVAPPTQLDHLEAVVAGQRNPLIIVVEDAEKPGNLGAIARSADGAGASGLVAAVGRGPAPDPWNPNAVRASLGTIFSLPIAVAPSDVVLSWLRGAGIGVVAARVQATTPHDSADLRGPLAIAVGSEAHGLGRAWLAPDVKGVRIPMLGHGDSLNVAAAAAILLYEARRQRDAGSSPREA